MYKRPTLRRVAAPRTRFASEVLPSGAKTSFWTEDHRVYRAANGTPGRVGEMIDNMRAGNNTVRHPALTVWTPPEDYQFVAKHMPVEQQAAYIARCENWYAANPPKRIVKACEVPAYNTVLISKLFAKYSPHVPPIEARLMTYEVAGYSAAYIEKARVRAKMLEETVDERQQKLDAIFAKWPSASKPTPKKAKVIKAVKKRL